MTLNPAPIGSWLYELVEHQWTTENYPCWQFSLRDNTLLPGLAEHIRQAETMYPADKWPSEIDGYWAASGGAAYRQFKHR